MLRKEGSPDMEQPTEDVEFTGVVGESGSPDTIRLQDPQKPEKYVEIPLDKVKAREPAKPPSDSVTLRVDPAAEITWFGSELRFLAGDIVPSAHAPVNTSADWICPPWRSPRRPPP
jgi:hypothetical protein